MEIEAFEARFAEAVQRSFRDDAIRTAVLIDDQFPDYIRMHGATAGEFREVERAKKIYGFMHDKGLICDIQNWRKPGDADLGLLDKIRKSDLILLDYQLGAAGTKASLGILRHLAVSSHFNLVVLYTSTANQEVALAVAAAMRGREAEDALPEEASQAAEAVLERDDFQIPDVPGLKSYLTDNATPWIGDLKTAFLEAKAPLKYLKTYADRVGRRWADKYVGEYVIDETGQLPIGCAVEPDRPLWVHCGSCFVAVVQKLPTDSTDDEGEHVWKALGDALRAWRPNVYRLVLSEIQNALELEDIAHHEKWLNDELALGLGLYLLESENVAQGGAPASDIEGTTQNLIDRFVDIIRQRLAAHPRITGTANDLLSAKLSTSLAPAAAGENARLVRARELAHVSADREVDWTKKVVPAANAFMASDAFRGAHITTGTVLEDAEGGFWLCASPACDLVPRSAGPVIVQVMRLARENTPPDKFTRGEFVVVRMSGEVAMLRALEAKARQPSLLSLILPEGTRVVRDAENGTTISAWIATPSGLRIASAAHGFEAQTKERSQSSSAVADRAEKAPPIVPATFKVLSQLRSAFATRFLMAAGQHQSRVGVDFIDP